MFRNSGQRSSASASKSSSSSSSLQDPSRINNPRERAQAIRKQQDEALARLPLNSLYIVLFLRSDPPNANDFHWSYYFHTNAKSGGNKYHITNLSGGWIPDHAPSGGVFKSNFLCVLIHIATVTPSMHAPLNQIIRSLDGSLNSIPGVTCRVWVMTILEQLVRHGIVRCNSAAALEQECKEIGNHYMHAAAANQQPRPVVKSKVCA